MWFFFLRIESSETRFISTFTSSSSSGPIITFRLQLSRSAFHQTSSSSSSSLSSSSSSASSSSSSSSYSTGSIPIFSREAFHHTFSCSSSSLPFSSSSSTSGSFGFHPYPLELRVPSHIIIFLFILLIWLQPNPLEIRVPSCLLIGLGRFGRV